MSKLRTSALASLLLATSCLANAAAPDGLIGHWSLDDDSGKNSASSAFNAEIKGVKFVPGVFGNAVEFDGKKGSVAIPAAMLPADLKQVTFSAWIAPTKYVTVNYRKVKRRLPPFKFLDDGTIFGKDDAEESRLTFGLQEDRFLTLGLSVGRNYAECDAYVPQKELCDGNWHHVAGTFDGKTMRVYLDGRVVGTTVRQGTLSTFHDFVGGWAPVDGTLGRPFFIGSRIGENPDNSPRFLFTGKIDDVRFYSTALNDAKVAALYAAAKLPTSAAALAAREAATKLFKKGTDFTTTLTGTAVALNAVGDNLSDEVSTEVHRLIAAAFPQETSDYIIKWQKSPVELLLFSQSKLDKHAKELANDKLNSPFEYLPLTDLQWSVLSPGELAKWKFAKDLKAKLDANKPTTLAEVLFLKTLFTDRPQGGERVAWAGDNTNTPATKTRTAAEGRKLIENDWLYQVGGKPSIVEARKEIAYAKKILARIELSKADTDAYTAKLDALEKKIEARDGSPKDLYVAVRTLKREIVFKNPVIDFDTLLYVDNPNPAGQEWQHETRHRLGYTSVSKGGRLLVQKGLSPDGELTLLAPSAPLGGTFWRPDLSFDASKVLFSFKPHNEKTFHIYEIGIDGKGLRQVTGGMFDDLDPIYLPDQKNILFTTTRGYLYVRCMPSTSAPVMAKVPLNAKPGDKNLYITSRNGEPEYLPSLMDDGRVIYTRWEYTDKPLWRAQSLWTMNQDTTNVQVFYGNQSVWPDVLKDARQIPGSNRIMFTGTAHHNWFAGSIGIIDNSKGLNFPEGLTKVTQEVEWPECGNGPTDPKESADYHRAPYSAYYSPYPLSEKEFLVSARRGGDSDRFVLLLMDTDGNRELIAEGTHSIRDAQPVRKRKIPQPTLDRVDWPTWAEREKPGTGKIYSNNVYENAPPELKDKAKYLRIWSIEHKTYSYWIKRPYASSGPELSAIQAEGIKKIIGTVPIEADGSVHFNAPAGIALHFQLLDKDHLALQTMKSFTGVQPGETRACFGCHEQKMNAPRSNQIGQAVRRDAANITPVPWNDITVGYERYVQPTLDKYCASCHADETKPASKVFNSRLRPGLLGFKEPYMTLVGNPTWGSDYKGKMGQTNTTGGFGWADTIMVEGYGTNNPAAYVTYPAMKRLSYVSRFIKRISGEKVTPEDKHPSIKVDEISRLRAIHWVDAMTPFSGAEELRSLEDPVFGGRNWLSIRPRINTAPVVPRPGPFDTFYTDEDPAYFPPDPASFNALPSGVSRSPASNAVVKK